MSGDLLARALLSGSTCLFVSTGIAKPVLVQRLDGVYESRDLEIEAAAPAGEVFVYSELPDGTLREGIWAINRHEGVSSGLTYSYPTDVQSRDDGSLAILDTQGAFIQFSHGWAPPGMAKEVLGWNTVPVGKSDMFRFGPLPTAQSRGAVTLDALLPSVADTEAFVGASPPPTDDTRQPSERVVRADGGEVTYEWPAVRDDFLRDAPLGEINTWIGRQWTNAAFALHVENARALAAQGHDVRGHDVVGDAPNKQSILTEAQWSALAVRAAEALRTGHAEVFRGGAAIAHRVQQLNMRTPVAPLAPSLDAAVTRLGDADPDVARFAASLIEMGATDLDAARHLPVLIEAARAAPDAQRRLWLVRAIGGVGMAHLGYAGRGEDVVALLQSTAEHPGDGRDDRLLRVSALSAIGWAFDAPQAAGAALARLYDHAHDDETVRQSAVRSFRSLCSTDSNPDAASRDAALAHALPVVQRALVDPSERVLGTACAFASDLGPDAAPFVPDLSRLLDHPDFHIQMAAGTALGFIGPAARPALPRIRELAAIPDGDWSYEWARDTLWILTGQGTKPNWYDDWLARRAAP